MLYVFGLCDCGSDGLVFVEPLVFGFFGLCGCGPDACGLGLTRTDSLRHPVEHCEAGVTVTVDVLTGREGLDAQCISRTIPRQEVKDGRVDLGSKGEHLRCALPWNVAYMNDRARFLTDFARREQSTLLSNVFRCEADNPSQINPLLFTNSTPYGIACR